MKVLHHVTKILGWFCGALEMIQAEHIQLFLNQIRWIIHDLTKHKGLLHTREMKEKHLVIDLDLLKRTEIEMLHWV